MAHAHQHHEQNGVQPHGHYAAQPHPAPVVLDLGGDVGALILHTGPEMLGLEVEISVSGEDDRRAHKEVLERQIDGHPAYTAVFDNVPAGRHTLWVDDVARERDVLVAGGRVAEVDWREDAGPDR